MKGDRVEIVVDTGTGVATYDITATKAGRRVEITTTRNITEVVEVTAPAPRYAPPASSQPA